METLFLHMIDFCNFFDDVKVIMATILLFFNFYMFLKWCKNCYKEYFDIHMLSYKNDDFAHDTIRYRFRDILYKLNNFYKDVVLSLYSNSLNEEFVMEKVKEVPFDYKKMLKAEFSLPTVLLNNLDKESKDILKNFYSKIDAKDTTYGTIFPQKPFIEVEHVFYFYILNIFYGLDKDIQSAMSNNMIENGIADPYKMDKERAIIEDLNKGLPMKLINFGNDLDDVLEELENNHNCSSILKCLGIIIVLEKLIIAQKENGVDWNKIDKILEIITFLSLESNTNDLSQLSDGRRKPIDKNDVYPNNLEDFTNHIRNLKEKTQVNYLIDNSGVEFFTDLTFAYVLIRVSPINQITLHINKLPVFVSDVIASDYLHMMNLVDNYIIEKKLNDYEDAIELIKNKKKNGEILIRPDFIWNMPTPYKDLAENYTEIFSSKKSILIIKGDLNYRRLIEDKNWNFKEKITKFVKGYISCPTLLVRSIKSDLIIDFYEKQGQNKKKKWEEKDKYWKEYGEYGVIRFIKDYRSRWEKIRDIILDIFRHNE